jgi:hypothetical protein
LPSFPARTSPTDKEFEVCISQSKKSLKSALSREPSAVSDQSSFCFEKKTEKNAPGRSDSCIDCLHCGIQFPYCLTGHANRNILFAL